MVNLVENLNKYAISNLLNSVIWRYLCLKNITDSRKSEARDAKMNVVVKASVIEIWVYAAAFMDLAVSLYRPI